MWGLEIRSFSLKKIKQSAVYWKGNCFCYEDYKKIVFAISDFFYQSIALRCLLLIQDKLWDQIHVEVRDFRYYVQPLIFKDSFHDFNLQTGDNILSQNWRQRRLTSQFNSSNDFRSSNFYVLIIKHLNNSEQNELNLEKFILLLKHVDAIMLCVN